jgi:hypothetical protein
MVYGEVKGYSDKNLSKIVGIMRSFPFILLPKSNGLRQPIHATQLARVAYKQSQRILTGSWSNNEPNVLILGGDSILSYESMLTKIKSEIPKNDSAKRCIILTIPEKLFFILIAVFLPVNPKLFESMMRINSNLSNFTMAHQVLEEPPIQFPVHPLATKS